MARCIATPDGLVVEGLSVGSANAFVFDAEARSDSPRLSVAAGADGITAHLREDRRHISDTDIARLKAELTRPLNLEMAATPEMLEIALRHLPHACCLVPERREERTTEGGLDVVGGENHLKGVVDALQQAGIRVSLFIEPDQRAIEAAHRLGADIVELHTGTYCETALENDAAGVQAQIRRITAAGVSSIFSPASTR